MPLDTASLKAAIQSSFANQNAGIEQVLDALKRLPSVGNAASAGVLARDDQLERTSTKLGQLQDLTNVLHRLNCTTKEAASLKRACEEVLSPPTTSTSISFTKVSIPAVPTAQQSRYESPEPERAPRYASPTASPSHSSPNENGHTQDAAGARPDVCSNCRHLQAVLQDMRQDLESHKGCAQHQTHHIRCSSTSPNGSNFALASTEEALVAAKAEVVEKSAQCEALRSKLEATERSLRKLSKLVADAAKQRVELSPRGSEGARQEFVELMELQGLCSAMQLRGSGLQVVQSISSQGAQVDAMLEAALAQVKDLKAEMMMEWDEFILSPAGNSFRNEPLSTPSCRSLPDLPDHLTTARALAHDPPPTPPPFTSTPTTPAGATPSDPHPNHPHPNHLYQPPAPPFLSQPPHAAPPAANGGSAPPPPAAPLLEDPLIDLTYSLEADALVDLPLGLDSPVVTHDIPQLPPGVPPFHALPQNFQEMFYHDREEFYRIIDEFLQAAAPPL